MKILVIVDSYPPHHGGGYELRCKDVIDRLIQKGHSVKIISTKAQNQDKKNHREEDIYRVLHSEDNSKPLYRRIYYDYQDVKFLDTIIKSFKPEIIYLWHTINLTRTIFPYLAECNIPIVYDEGGIGLSWAWQHHGPWYTMIDHKSSSPIKNYTKSVLSFIVNFLSSGLIKKRFQWPIINTYFNSLLNLDNALIAKVPLNKCQVIYSGIELSNFKFKETREFHSPIEIITPGRIVPNKGSIDSIRLILELKKKNIHAKLKIIGKPANKAYLQEILTLIKEFHLEENIAFVDFVSHDKMNELYWASDFCFFPSYHKSGFSRIPLEAMASGCLVLTYGNEGSDEIISDNETGCIVPEGNISLASDLIEEVIQKPDIYRKYIIAARNEIEQKYDMKSYVDKIENYLLGSMKMPSNG